MPLVTIQDLSVRFRGPWLLDSVHCQIDTGERIGLLGRNGAGKTTLLRILSGDMEPDQGQVILAPHSSVALLPQEVPRHLTGTVAEVIRQGTFTSGATTSAAAESEADDQVPQWKREQNLDQIVSRMSLDPNAMFSRLSSGMKRRVLLARALVTEPDMLLLDEPTNHLDIDAIVWLEEFLGRWAGTLIFITHDRMFLRRLATRILEIDRGRLFDWACDYDTFLRRKAAALDAAEKQAALFDKRLAQEEAWIRQGIKARRTRNEGRVRLLEQMRRERSERQRAPGNVKLEIDTGARSGNLIVEVDGISFAYGDHAIVRNFSTSIMRGDKVGLIGPNGVGKTTLLRILLGELPPQQGSVRLGTNLQIAYFDQLREQLDEERSVIDNVGEGSDTVRVGGKSKHVIGYLNDFLFTPERARTAVRWLSGGERNRVLLARLFAKPANVIVLDEPTNDLDVETLELLEERLVEYHGTLLVVSHDREFLNNVVTSSIVFEPGGVKEYAGGYDDWLRQRAADPVQQRTVERKSSTAPAAPTAPESSAGAPRRRLTYKEQQELATLPERIEQLETEIAALETAMAQPDFYQSPGERIAAERARLAALGEQLTAAFRRWQELEDEK